MAQLIVNGRVATGISGNTLMDVALENGIIIPQDCCTGQCGTCRVQLLSGHVNPDQTKEGKTILACRARLEGDAEIQFDPQPVTIKTSGKVLHINALSKNILEVIVAVKKEITYLPGQYVRVKFAGFPARDFSPTLALDGLRETNKLIFNIRKVHDGKVSSHLGARISSGHKIKLSGPYGSSFLRRNPGRIVLISSGTGFAPIWSIAVAARLHQPHRSMRVIASSRDPEDLYMQPAFDWLTMQSVTDLTLCASGAPASAPIWYGRGISFLPKLNIEDDVYACGAYEMVESVKKIALKSGCNFYADPFCAAQDEYSLLYKMKNYFHRKH